MLGLVGFMYSSSGLLPWQEPRRLISRTRGVIPLSLNLKEFLRKSYESKGDLEEKI
jgi:hypothetical protein